MSITHVEDRPASGSHYQLITFGCDGPGCDRTVVLNSRAPSEEYAAWATVLGFQPLTEDDKEHPDLGNVQLCSLRCLKAWAQAL